MACDATWGHADVCTCAATKGHVGACGPMAARVCVDVHSPCGWPWSVLESEAMLTSVFPAASEGLVWLCDPTAVMGPVLGLCSRQKPFGSPWSGLLLTVKNK